LQDGNSAETFTHCLCKGAVLEEEKHRLDALWQAHKELQQRILGPGTNVA
jgi:hypothetical protein